MSFQRYASLEKPKKVAPSTCYRCGGAGGAQSWPGWTCFRCGGRGVDPTLKDWAYPESFTDEQIMEHQDILSERNRKARKRREAKKRAELDANFEANLESHPELKPIAERYLADTLVPNGFVRDVLQKMRRFDITDAQVRAVLVAVEQDDIEAARIAEIPPIEEGLKEVEAKIVTMRWQDNQWGGGMKMLVELPEGQRLWGTVPSSLGDAEVEDLVAFTANVKPSEDDPTFGFFSRPRKGSVLSGRATAGRDSGLPS